MAEGIRIGGGGKKSGAYVWKKYGTKELNEVSYLQNSGTQSIDTGVNPNNNTRLLLDIEFLEIPSGISYVQGTGWYGLFYDPSGILEHFYYDTNWTGASISNSEILDRMTIDMSNTGLLTVTLSNGTKRTKQKTNSFTASIPSLPLNANVSKLYSYKIYDGNTLIRDFVPCKNENEEYGLFDKVNSKFYSNVGSGSYTGGNTTGNALQTKGDFIDFVVSDSESAYPDGGTQDGYWYEKVVEGAKVAYGTSSGMVPPKTITHGLGVIPTKIFIYPIWTSTDIFYTVFACIGGGMFDIGKTTSFSTVFQSGQYTSRDTGSISISNVTDSSFTINTSDSILQLGYNGIGWIAIAE